MEERPVVFAFGDFEADEALRELRREGRPVELQATPLRLLLYLLRNRDRVISKDELLDRVWSETAVSEGALSTALKEIRSALGDTGSQQRVIQTLRGQGYRLIATVEEHPATAPPTSEPARGPVSRPRLFIQEIHRRSLWQVLGIYLVGAWVAFQGIEALADGLAMPEWVPGFAVVVLILGLPIVLATAFVQEGVGAAAASEAGQATTLPGGAGLHLALTWRNVVLAGALVFGLSGIAAAGWLLLKGETAGSPETIRSIAVLPFVDMSLGGDQEYFADGMSEELINRLSKIEDLRVVARTSAFAFKGKNVDIREIGEVTVSPTLGLSSVRAPFLLTLAPQPSHPRGTTSPATEPATSPIPPIFPTPTRCSAPCSTTAAPPRPTPCCPAAPPSTRYRWAIAPMTTTVMPGQPKSR